MSRDNRPPTRKTQKNLVIALACSPLRSGKGEDCPSLIATWILKREDAFDWLQARRALFPGADAMEIAGLAILPNALRLSISATMCGAKNAKGSKIDLHACAEPNFNPFTASSAICTIHASSYGPVKDAPERFKKTAELMDAQIKSSMPKAFRLPDGFINQHASPEDALGAMVALSEKSQMLEQCEPTLQPDGVKPPRL